MQLVIVGYTDEHALFAIGPFESREAARDYADEFGGGVWIGWNIVELTKPVY